MAQRRRRARDQAQPGIARQGAARRRRAHGAVPGFGRRARLFGPGIHRRRGVVMRLLQFSDAGRTRVARVDSNGAVLPLARVESTWQLAVKAAKERLSLEQAAAGEAVEAPIAYAELLRDARILPPLTHPDPSHCLVSGTGLTHLGSAAARDAMHAKIDKQDDALTDSMKMFKWGVEGGKPVGSKPGMQPEWFYKGDGRNVVGSGSPLASPDFAEDHGEEPELVGLYLIDENRRPRRLGFAIGNEF